MKCCNASKPILWGWSLGATIALHLSAQGRAVATVAAGTYFGRIFTPAHVQAGIAKASGEVDRARMTRMGTWPEMWPNQVRNRLLMYTGTDDGNVVKQLELQRAQIEKSGATIRVLQDCNHLGLVSDTAKVSAIVEPFLRESNAEPRAGSDAGSF
jgi:pimeloyl-ACP methyl ester carboxylesterase